VVLKGRNGFRWAEDNGFGRSRTNEANGEYRGLTTERAPEAARVMLGNFSWPPRAPDGVAKGTTPNGRARMPPSCTSRMDGWPGGLEWLETGRQLFGSAKDNEITADYGQHNGLLLWTAETLQLKHRRGLSAGF